MTPYTIIKMLCFDSPTRYLLIFDIEKIVFMRHLYLFCVDDCLVSRVEWNKCRIKRVVSPYSSPKHVEIDKYEYTKNKLCYKLV